MYSISMKRDLYVQIMEKIETPEVLIVTGMRRVGKTTLLTQVQKSLPSQNSLFLDLENVLNRAIFEKQNYEEIVGILLSQGLNRNEKIYLFLDEIQHCPQIPSVLKYIVDHYQWKCFVTGSASYYIKNLFTESLAGRKILFELYPFSFSEFLRLKEIDITLPPLKQTISVEQYNLLIPYYREYMAYGGFPGVIMKSSSQDKKQALQDIFSSYFQQEVVSFGGFRRNDKIRDLLLLLASRVGSKIDISKISFEMGISRITIEEYLSFLQATYMITLISPYSKNRDTEIRKAKKVYFCDTGILTSLGMEDKGKLFENAIFHQLRTQGELNYYQKKSGAEIDFIVNKKIAFEVKNHVSPIDVTKTNTLATSIQMTQIELVSHEFTSAHAVYGFQI